MTEYLQGQCCDHSTGEQLVAVCWALATIYWTLLVTRQHPQGEEEESRATDTVATRTAVEQEEQPMLVAVIPIQKKNPRRNNFT